MITETVYHAILDKLSTEITDTETINTATQTITTDNIYEAIYNVALSTFYAVRRIPTKMPTEKDLFDIGENLLAIVSMSSNNHPSIHKWDAPKQSTKVKIIHSHKE